MKEFEELREPRDFIERLRLNLRAPHTIAPPLAGTERKVAAVLLALMQRGSAMHLLYTRRSDRLKSHPGQVAFPGGRFDRRDPHLLAAALRETHEEVGIPPQLINVLGTFEGHRTHSTDILVTPFVGVIDGSPELRPDPKEVAEIFEVPLDALRDPGHRGTYKWRNNGFTSNRPAILYGGQIIWGLTYELTMRFLELAPLE
ncbi:MAG TPA: CoA pyrophosphatase [Candidatus Binataceae bacterium]|nr:CoA pyrophosphatase [Candidatus Binataceae bacterium]